MHGVRKKVQKLTIEAHEKVDEFVALAWARVGVSEQRLEQLHGPLVRRSRGFHAAGLASGFRESLCCALVAQKLVEPLVGVESLGDVRACDAKLRGEGLLVQNQVVDALPRLPRRAALDLHFFTFLRAEKGLDDQHAAVVVDLVVEAGVGSNKVLGRNNDC